MRRSVSVEIAGQRYVIKSDSDEAHVSSVAKFVDEKIRELKQVTRTVSIHQVAILAALNIADDLLREQSNMRELKRRIRERTKGALEFLEREVTTHGV